MIVGFGIGAAPLCQFKHYTLQSLPFLPSLSYPLVVTFQKCKHLPLEGSDNLHKLVVPTMLQEDAFTKLSIVYIYIYVMYT
jgi:hypothetical protein